jgi:hypothetical protein
MKIPAHAVVHQGVVPFHDCNGVMLLETPHEVQRQIHAIF